MQVLPQTREQWLRFLTFPFKAYVVIAPALLFVYAALPKPRNAGVADPLVLMVFLIFPVSLLLLIAALIFTCTGKKDIAWGCALFAVAGLFLGYYLLPYLSS